MLSFRSAQNFVVVYFAICFTQSYCTPTNTVQPKSIQCINAYSAQSSSYANCNDNQNAQWNCTTSTCGRLGHQWVPMDGCLLGRVPGTSSQQCASYGVAAPGVYGCRNSGGRVYECPYTSSNVPFLTCKACVPPVPPKPEPPTSGGGTGVPIDGPIMSGGR